MPIAYLQRAVQRGKRWCVGDGWARVGLVEWLTSRLALCEAAGSKSDFHWLIGYSLANQPSAPCRKAAYDPADQRCNEGVQSVGGQMKKLCHSSGKNMMIGDVVI